MAGYDVIMRTALAEEPAAEAPKPIRVMPSRVPTISLKGEYAGWWFKARVSMSLAEYEELTENPNPTDRNARFKEMRAVLQDRTVEWNFVDRNGEPLPVTKEGFDELNLELMVYCYREYMDHFGSVPL